LRQTRRLRTPSTGLPRFPYPFVDESSWNSMFSALQALQEDGSSFLALFHLNSLSDCASNVFGPVDRDRRHSLL
jgi:hypothetical protein